MVATSLDKNDQGAESDACFVALKVESVRDAVAVKVGSDRGAVAVTVAQMQFDLRRMEIERKKALRTGRKWMAHPAVLGKVAPRVDQPKAEPHQPGSGGSPRRMQGLLACTLGVFLVGVLSLKVHFIANKQADLTIDTPGDDVTMTENHISRYNTSQCMPKHINPANFTGDRRLDMLKTYAIYLNEYHIEWWIIYGTMMGAVRGDVLPSTAL